MRALPFALVLFACAPAAVERGPSPEERGPHPVGSRTLFLTDSARQRTLPVEVWYPADESARASEAAGEPVTNLVAREEDRPRYEALLAAAPESCPTRQVRSARDAAPAAGTWPLVVISHCHTCTRFAYASIAEHLASRGIAVAAPDHLGNTLFDALDDKALGLNRETLELRLGDMQLVLAVLLDAGAAEVPEALRGRFDAGRLGAMGHSFGSVTVGALAAVEPRLKAVAGLAAPMENPLFPSVKLEAVTQPALLVVAREDNSILEVGNDLIRENFENLAAPAWKVELDDAGHFSFTELAGIRPNFMAGCGEGKRQTNPGETFTYASIPAAVDTVRTWAAALFAAHLQESEPARAFLAAPPARAGVAAERR